MVEKNQDSIKPSEDIDPQLQQKVDTYTANAIRTVHDRKTSDKIVDAILESDDPIRDIANYTLEIAMRQQAGPGPGPETFMEPQVFLPVAYVVMNEIMTMAESAGLEKLSEEDKAKAASTAIGKYFNDSVASGGMSKEDLISVGQQAAESPEGENFREATKNIEPAQPATAQGPTAPGAEMPPGLMGGV